MKVAAPEPCQPPRAPVTGSDTPRRAVHTAAAAARLLLPSTQSPNADASGLLKRHAKDSCHRDATGLVMSAETLGASSPARPCCWLIKG